MSRGIEPFRSRLKNYKWNLWIKFFNEMKVIIVKRIHRSSHPEVFLVKVVLKICSKFTGEHPCRSVILIKCFGRLLMAIITFATCESWDFDIGTCHQHGFFILLQHGVIILNYNIITPWLQWVRPWLLLCTTLKNI